MDGKRKRLRLVVTLLELSNAEVADETKYTGTRVSDFLKLNGTVEPSDKFLATFCSVFPKANLDYLMTGTGAMVNDVDLSAYNIGAEGEAVSSLKAENKMLQQMADDNKNTAEFYKLLITKAYQLDPSLKGKLASFLSLVHGENKEVPNLLIDINTPGGTTFKNSIGDLTTVLAAS